MKTALVVITIGLAVMFFNAEARAEFGKSAPPTLEVLQLNVLAYGGEGVKGIKVIGLFKESENKYLIITDRNSDNWGGPYSLLRLESNEWVMTKPGQLFTQFVPVRSEDWIYGKQRAK